MFPSLPEIVEIFSLPFMTRSLVTVVVLAVAGALIGVFVNLRNLEFISDGLAHSVFPGLVIGYVAAGTDGVFLGALIAALVASVLLTVVSRRGVGSDAGIAVVLASMFSIGIVIVSRQSGYVSQLEDLLFGRLLTVTDSQVRQIVVVGVIATLLVVATWRAQLFRAFDPQGFRAAGYRELPYDVVLNVAVALVVVAGSQAIGNLLVLALLIVPVAVARLITTHVAWVAPVAAVVSVLCGVVGLLVGYQASVVGGVSPSPSAVVVLVMIVVYLLVLVAYVLGRQVRLWRLSRPAAGPGLTERAEGRSDAQGRSAA